MELDGEGSAGQRQLGVRNCHLVPSAVSSNTTPCCSSSSLILSASAYCLAWRSSERVSRRSWINGRAARCSVLPVSRPFKP